MPEYVPPDNRFAAEGHFPKTETALLELYRLMAIFLASKSFAELRENYPGEGQDAIYTLQQCEEEEITRILLMLAVTARVIDDREGRPLNRAGTNCGKLVPDLAAPVEEVLTLREACNKIIHAQKVRVDIELPETVQTYLNPIIYIYGEQGKLKWKATLDVIAFAKEYVACIGHF